MSLYELNKDLLIKLISTIQDISTLSDQELLKLRCKVSKEIQKRIKDPKTYKRCNYSRYLDRQLKANKKALLNFHELSQEFTYENFIETKEELSLHLTIFDITNQKVEKLNTGFNYTSTIYSCDDKNAFLLIFIDFELYCLTTDRDYYPSLEELSISYPKEGLNIGNILEVTNININYVKNKVKMDVEKY